MAQLVHRYWYYLSNIGLFYLMAKETFWFKHDYDAADDDKTMLLIEQLGLEGYGIYWILIEKLRGRDGYKMPFSVIPSLARRYMTTPEKMKTVIMQYGLFEYDDEGFFYSVSLIERMNALDDLKNKRSMAGRLGNEKRWGNSLLSEVIDEDIANLSQCDSTAIANHRYKNRIDKNREEKEIDESISKKKKDEKSEEDAFIDKMYKMYPTKCPMRNTSLGKSRKDKQRIKKLLKTYSKEDIERVFKHEIDEKYGKSYMQNFSTFLNNFPDPDPYINDVDLFNSEETTLESNQVIINGQIYK